MSYKALSCLLDLMKACTHDAESNVPAVSPLDLASSSGAASSCTHSCSSTRREWLERRGRQLSERETAHEADRLTLLHGRGLDVKMRANDGYEECVQCLVLTSPAHKRKPGSILLSISN